MINLPILRTTYWRLELFWSSCKFDKNGWCALALWCNIFSDLSQICIYESFSAVLGNIINENNDFMVTMLPYNTLLLNLVKMYCMKFKFNTSILHFSLVTFIGALCRRCPQMEANGRRQFLQFYTCFSSNTYSETLFAFMYNGRLFT